MIRLYEIAAFGLIIGITDLHAEKFAANKPVGPLFHTLWALIYLVPCAVIAALNSSWWLMVAFTLERFVFYNLILNIWRTKPFFYIHSGLNGSWWDDLELKWSGVYPYAWGVGLLGLIIVNFII